MYFATLLLAIATLVMLVLAVAHVGHIFLVIGLILTGVTLVMLALGERVTRYVRRV